MAQEYKACTSIPCDLYFLSALIHWKYEIKFSKYLASLSWPFALSAELSQSHFGNNMDNLICLVFTKLSRFPFWFAFC